MRARASRERTVPRAIPTASAISWYEFALMVVEEIGRKNGHIKPALAVERGEAADRPAYSPLSSARYDEKVGVPMRPVREALRDFLGGMTRA